jgi:hypothetical protein
LEFIVKLTSLKPSTILSISSTDKVFVLLDNVVELVIELIYNERASAVSVELVGLP